MEGLRQSFVKASEKFVEDYPNYIAERKLALGSMFNEHDYPDVERIRTKFFVNIEITPLPSGDHLLLSIGDQERRELAENIEKSVSERLEAAQKDCWVRVLDVVKHFATVMADTDRIFQSSTVEKIRKVCEIAPKLNIANDQRLNDVVSQILTTLGGYDPDTLRESFSVRRQAADDARIAVQQIEQAMNRPA